MTHIRSAIVGLGVASVAALLYSIFFLKTIQVWEGWMAGVIAFEPPLIQPSLIAVFIAAFALGFLLMARRQRASD